MYLRTLRLIAERYCDTLNFEDMKKGEVVEIVSKIEDDRSCRAST
jgi:hypothetical protein